MTVNCFDCYKKSGCSFNAPVKNVFLALLCTIQNLRLNKNTTKILDRVKDFKIGKVNWVYFLGTKNIGLFPPRKFKDTKMTTKLGHPKIPCGQQK